MIFFFFFACQYYFETTEIGGVYQNGNFYQEKNISRWEKMKKCDFAASEKYSSYATVCLYMGCFTIRVHFR